MLTRETINVRLAWCVVAAFVFAAFVGSVREARAASLYVSPSGGSFVTGTTFTVSIFVNTGGESINAIEANLTFPPDKLQVVSPSAGQSFIKTWIAQPTYSNSEGTLRFQGAMPNPGIMTEAGLVSTVTFRTRSVGNATVRFLDTSRVLLNDGQGTDVLDRTSGATFAIVLPPPQGPIVTSRTNPDPGKWYSSNKAAFEWVAPIDILGYSYILSEDPNGEPDEISEGTGTRVAYDNLSDGTYYFHVKAFRQNTWGGITTYPIQIDQSPPAEFGIEIVPSASTARRIPIIQFTTTDNLSGVDYYELAIISLDKPAGDSPFFIETTSPYINTFEIGRYQVVVRSYDKAGNYLRTQRALSIVNPVFEIIGAQGVRLGGAYTIPWPYVIAFGLLVLAGFSYLAYRAWMWHALIEEIIRHGAIVQHPGIAPQLKELQAKQEEYGLSRRPLDQHSETSESEPGSGSDGTGSDKKLMGLLGFLALASLLGLFSAAAPAHAAELENISAPNPPVITLFPKTISNDEIFYVGGEASVPGAEILIYVERTDTKATTEKSVIVNKKGEWFYSFPQFFDSGHYIVWAQIKAGGAISPPSARIDVTVAPTAFQIGEKRLSAQSFYLMLTILFLAAVMGLLAFIAYHGRHARRKNLRLQEEIKKAEESIRRGFSVLRRDIEEELAVVRRAKLNKELSREEKMREEKLLADIEAVSRYVGKEIWEVEKEVEGV